MTIIELLHIIQDYLQWIMIAFLIGSLWLFWKWTNRNVYRRQWGTPALTAILHNLLFYVYVQAANIIPLYDGFFTFWATIVRVHWIVVVFLTIWALNKLNGKVVK